MINKVLVTIFLSLVINCAVALTPIKLALDWYINPDHAPILVGIQKGYFKQHGLQLQLVTPTQSSEPAQLLAANKVNLALDYQPDLMEQIAAGMPIHWVANLTTQPLACLTVLASSGINSLSQLKGKTIGGATSPASSVMVKTMLRRHGVQPNEVRFISVNMGLTQALLSHQIDAVSGMMRNVEPVQLRMMGIRTRLFFPEKNGVPPYHELVVAANNTTSKQTITAFNAALQESIVDLQKHPHQDWRLVAKAYQTQLAATPHMAKVNRMIWLATVKYFDNKPTQINAKAYQRFERFLRKAGVLQKSIDLSTYTGQSL